MEPFDSKTPERSPTAFLGVIVACLLAWSACDPGGDGTRCQDDVDCPGLQVCTDQVCTEPGSADDPGDEESGDGLDDGTNDGTGDDPGDDPGDGGEGGSGGPDAGSSGVTEEICDDGIDNDGDGLTDCDDTADCDCHQVAQDPCGAVVVRCGDVIEDTTVGGTHRIDVHSGCSQWDDTGPERIYLVEDVRPGTLHANLVEMQEGIDLDIFVHEDGCAPETCKEMGSHEAWCGVDPDKAYYIIVDGYQGDAGTYTLEVDCQGNHHVDIQVPQPAVVGEPARFSGTASAGIDRVVVTVDGWEIGDEPVTDGGYAFSYTFTSAGQDRAMVARGLDAGGAELARDETTVDVVQGDTGPCIEGVPYFYQYHNSINPGGSCQNTSMAMVLRFYGAASETPDAISSHYGTSQAQSVAGYQQVFNSEASYFGLSVRDRGTTGGSLQQVRNLLAQGKPVVVHGYFTGYGHVIVLLGYDGTHYCAHDPAGVWNQQYQGGGYTGYDPQGGRYVRYRKAALEQAIAPDGLVWMHEPIP